MKVKRTSNGERLISVLRLPCLVLLAATGLFGNPTDDLIRRVEQHYNAAQTLSVQFVESYSNAGRQRKPESGRLTLRKAGKMRWDYSDPSGKLFVSDGKNVFLFTASDNRVERWRLKDTEDMRAPLAFLLGRMDMKKEFTAFQTHADEQGQWLKAAAKSDKAPYEQIELLISPAAEIRRLTIAGRDGSRLTYQFGGERLNVATQEAEFRFSIPPGAQVIDSVGSMKQGN